MLKTFSGLEYGILDLFQIQRERRRERRGQRWPGPLTLHPLFAFALLSVLLLEFGYQALVHVPGLPVLLYTGRRHTTAGAFSQ